MKSLQIYIGLAGIVAASGLSFIACGSNDATTILDPIDQDAGKDSSSADTGTADTGTADTASADTGNADTGTADTGTADTGTADTGTADTGTADTGTADTGTADTGTPDTSVQDSAADVKPDTGPTWPISCDAQPAGVPAKTLQEIWQANPITPSPSWLAGVYVTAISKGGCQANTACQIFVQSAETFATFNAGAHQAMKVFISANTAQYFTSAKVGDKVNVYANAWRYDTGSNPKPELLLQVSLAQPGCIQKIGTGNLAPITSVKLSDLSVDAYLQTHGPLLIKVDTVSGKPNSDPAKTFAIWNTSGPFSDAGVESIVSLSPYFLAGGAFSSLPIAVNFKSVTGVFGLFSPSADAGIAPQYMQIYPRTMADLVQ